MERISPTETNDWGSTETRVTVDTKKYKWEGKTQQRI